MSMENSGLLTLYALENVADRGMMPVEKLVYRGCCYYSDRIIGFRRAYAAFGADRRVDRLVRCHNHAVPDDAKYVILEDGNQYLIDLVQVIDDGATDLTLVRLESNYDVITADT